jgi:hypothetical protein
MAHIPKESSGGASLCRGVARFIHLDQEVARPD